MINIPLDFQIEELELNENMIELLHKHNIFLIRDLWMKTRKDLKKMNFNDEQIKYFSIKLQLWSLDLGEKMY